MHAPGERRFPGGGRAFVHRRLDAYLDAVGGTDPQRRRGAAHPARAALGAAGVGSVLVVVRLDVLPAGPVGGSGGAGADLDAAAQFGAGVVPDHADERERPYGPSGDALFGRGGAEAPVVAERDEREGSGAARGGGLGLRRLGRGLCRGGQGRRKGESGRAGDADRGSKESTHAPDRGHRRTYLSIGEVTASLPRSAEPVARPVRPARGARVRFCA